MRLFVAIDLTEKARRAVAAEASRVRRELGEKSGTWVRPEQMHLTLVFIGEVDETRAGQIADLISPEIPIAPFRMVFGGIGVFPPHGAPKILWLGAQHGTSNVIELQRLVVDRLKPAGVEQEERPFHPHLTLARWKKGGGPQRRRLMDGPSAVAEVQVDA